MESTKKYHIEKNTVQETLIIPLFARKICAEKFPQLFNDQEAVRICGMLDYDFAAKAKKMNSSVGLFGALEVAQRQYDLAWEVRDYLTNHPNASVVNLGCGPSIRQNARTILRLVRRRRTLQAATPRRNPDGFYAFKKN